MFKVIDLFSGAGGLSLASKLLKIKLVGALEIDHYSCETYRKNIIKKNKKIVLVEKDITKLDPTNFMRLIGVKKGECDLIVGGPPCQGFSFLRNGRKKDPRNELLWHYFEYVKAIAPKAFLIENVPGMLWKKNRMYVDRFYELAEESDYHVFSPEILDAKNYGVPQTRKRVFIYGVRKRFKKFSGKSWPPKITHADSKSPEVKKGLIEPYVLAKTVFKPALAKDDINNIRMQHSEYLVDIFKSTPKNGGSRHESSRTLKCHKNHDGHKDVYGRVNPNTPGPTMTAYCTNPSKGRFVHPTKHHGITVRHAARFQTFPEDFIFFGGIVAASKQVGNAVPIELGKKVIKQILRDLKAIEKS